MRRLIKAAVFLALVAVAGGGYRYWQGPAGQDKGRGEAKGGRGALPVKATRAVVKSMPVVIDAVGTVEAEQSVTLRAQVGGVLQSILFKEGDKIKAGQVLFEIDPRTYQAQYNQALAALARDRAQLENARVQQARLEPLLKREFITRQEFDVAVTSTKSLEATVESDKAQVEQARIQLEYSRIHSPLSGRTGALAVKVGNLVTASTGSGGTTLVTINSMDPILVALSVPERQLDEIRRYQSDPNMKIEIVPNREGAAIAEGKLVFVDNTVTPQTGTVLLKTRVANARELLWPGQFVNVRIVLTVEPEAIVVPEVAVQPGQEGPFVYLIEDSKVKIRPVKVARQIGGEVVVAAGVKAGDRVLTEIPQALAEGVEVRVAAGDNGASSQERRGRDDQGKAQGGKDALKAEEKDIAQGAASGAR